MLKKATLLLILLFVQRKKVDSNQTTLYRKGIYCYYSITQYSAIEQSIIVEIVEARWKQFRTLTFGAKPLNLPKAIHKQYQTQYQPSFICEKAVCLPSIFNQLNFLHLFEERLYKEPCAMVMNHIILYHQTCYFKLEV